MKKIYFLLFMTLFFVVTICEGAQQQKTVAFFTSIDLWDAGPFYNRGMFREDVYRLEKIFREHFLNTEFNVLVKHNANQADVWNTLHNPNVIALFWMSHTAATAESAVIADSRGFNILPAFLQPHRNLKYLGIIGCDGKEVLNNMRLSGGFSNNKNLITYGETGEIYKWDQALKRHLFEQGQWEDATKDRNEESPPAENIRTLTLNRKIPLNDKSIPAVRVELINGRVIGVFPPGLSGEVQSIEVQLEDTYKNDIIFSAGNHAAILMGKLTEDDIELGTLEVPDQNDGSKWVLFRQWNGNPYGIVKNIYRFIGQINKSE